MSLCDRIGDIKMIYQQLYYDPKKHKSVVLFLHAFPLNSKMWKPQFEKLCEENIPFLAIDYPGFGRSALSSKDPSMDDFADEIYSAVKRISLDKVVVVGLSMGGYVALSLYRDHPDIFQGLVLANTKAIADTEEGREKRFKLIEEIRKDPSMSGLIRFHLEKFYTAETRTNKPVLINLAETLMKKAKPEGVIHALKAMANRKDSTDLLKEISFPVLVIAGENDSLIPISDSQFMVDNLKNGELAVIPNAAHLSNIESSEAFNKSLIKYLSKVMDEL